MKKKRCPHCQTYFIPHPSVNKRQRVCGKNECQKLRKANNNKKWRQNNPKHYRGDYLRLKAWLDKHPGYLKQYRQNHPEYTQKNKKAQLLRDRSKKLHLDIQAKLTRQHAEIINKLWDYSNLDIQAELTLKRIEITFLFSHLSHLDIQAEIDRHP
jgi:hypothetical protein